MFSMPPGMTIKKAMQKAQPSEEARKKVRFGMFSERPKYRSPTEKLTLFVVNLPNSVVNFPIVEVKGKQPSLKNPVPP